MAADGPVPGYTYSETGCILGSSANRDPAALCFAYKDSAEKPDWAYRDSAEADLAYRGSAGEPDWACRDSAEESDPACKGSAEKPDSACKGSAEKPGLAYKDSVRRVYLKIDYYPLRFFYSFCFFISYN